MERRGHAADVPPRHQRTNAAAKSPNRSSRVSPMTGTSTVSRDGSLRISPRHEAVQENEPMLDDACVRSKTSPFGGMPEGHRSPHSVAGTPPYPMVTSSMSMFCHLGRTTLGGSLPYNLYQRIERATRIERSKEIGSMDVASDPASSRDSRS